MHRSYAATELPTKADSALVLLRKTFRWADGNPTVWDVVLKNHT